jgi:hypothetical protein
MGIGVGRAGTWALMGSAAALALVLAGCDGGSASAPARNHASASLGGGARAGGGYSSDRAGGTDSGGYRADSYRSGGSGGGDYADDPRREPVKLVHGKPMWAANRRHTADENAEYHFEHDGADFGAKTVDDYIAKVHAFVDTPGKDVESLTRRNGDKLLYDPKDNVFAVVTREGAPRTMFKPRDGGAYWDQQKQQIAQQDKSGSDAGDDSGKRSRYSRRAYRGSSSSDDQG